MNATKILIHVVGGVVQSVYSNDPTVDVNVFDVDNLKETNTHDEIDSKFDKAIVGLNEVPI